MIDLNEEDFDPVPSLRAIENGWRKSFILRSQEVDPVGETSDLCLSPSGGVVCRASWGLDRSGLYTWGYLLSNIRKLNLRLPEASNLSCSKEKQPVFATSMAPTWWYKIFSGPLHLADSYGISVLKECSLEPLWDQNQACLPWGESDRCEHQLACGQHLQKVAVKKLW